MSVSKQDLEQIAFEIVAYSGDARSKLLQAVKEAKNKNFEVCRKLIEDAKECLASAHKSQTLFITSEAQGDNIEISFLTVHAQDHLMTKILLKDIIDSLLDIYI